MRFARVLSLIGLGLLCALILNINSARTIQQPPVVAPVAASALGHCAECPCHGDPVCDGFFGVLDVVAIVSVALRNGMPVGDPLCPRLRTDINCDGCVDIRDIVGGIDVAFRGASTLCDACNCITAPLTCVAPSPGVSGSVVIEPKSVQVGATGVEVGVFIANDVPITALALPLELRSVTPGSYISGAVAATFFRAVPGGRVDNSPLGSAGPNWPAATVVKRYFAVPAGNTCSGPVSNTYKTSAALPDFVSPDALLYATVSNGNAGLGEDENLDVGADLPGSPSFKFTFDVSAMPGTFEIDTCCVTPCNHLLFVESSTRLPLLPSFTKGVVTIQGEVGFDAIPRFGDAPLTVFFSEINLTGNPFDSWAWTFGDGGTSNQQNPVHSYTTVGQFDVSLTATRAGQPYTASASKFIRVDPIVADFSGTPRAGGVSLPVTFTDLSTGSPTSWLWEFGDGTTSSDQNPMHTYANVGLYDVTLTAWNTASLRIVRKLRYIHVDAVAAPDLEVTAVGNTRPRPGFQKTYIQQITNPGSAASAASTLTFTIPPPCTYVVSAPPGTPTGGIVTWAVPSLSFGDPPLGYNVTVQVPVGTPAGTALIAMSTVDVVAGELITVNNTDVDIEPVVASVDPNDLVVQPGGCGPDHDFFKGTPSLTYTVFFENKAAATAEAIYVLVVDTLDPDLDWGSLQLGPSSKDNVLTTNFDPFTGEIRWFFDGINLPPNVNPPEGEGFVAYTVTPKPGLSDGTVISSRAHIRFDFEAWLSAPEAGPLELTLGPCPPCDCPCHGDPVCDGIICDVLDVVDCVAVAFRSAPSVFDPICPRERTDLDCNRVTDVLDVVNTVAVAFRSADPATRFCANPCSAAAAE